MTPHQSTSNRIHKGFGLVELMVAMTIGLVISLTIFSALNTFEGRKRTSTSVNDTNQAGSFAIYALEKWIRNAGSGFTQNTDGAFDYLLCTLTATKGGTQLLPRTSPLPAPFNTIPTSAGNEFRLMPLLIFPGQTTPSVSGHTSDALVIMSGSAGMGESAVPFKAATTSSALTVYSAQGFQANDIVLVARKGALGACMLEQISSVDLTDMDAQKLNLSGTYYGATINSVSLASAQFCSTATTPATARKCSALNLGNVATTSGNFANPPSFIVVGVGNDNTLFGYDLLQTQSTTSSVASAVFPIADNVFELHALYGIDTNNDGAADSWVRAENQYAPSALIAADGSGIGAICRIKAVRIGLIMRTNLQEKDDISTGPITLFSDLGNTLETTRPLSGDEEKYRYRTLEMTIPLRNMLTVTSCPTA